MMRALYRIGELQKSHASDPLTDVVDPVKSGSYVVCLDLRAEKNGEIVLVRPEKPYDYFEAKADNILAIGLKSGTGKAGPNFTPVAIVTFDSRRDTKEKIRTFDRKLLAFYKSYKGQDIDILGVKKFFEDTDRVASLREQFYDFMLQRQEAAKKDKHQFVLTVRIDGKLPGQIEAYRKLLAKSATEAIGAGRSEGQGNCTLTLAEGVAVYGRAGKDFPFYTIDKPGMITGGFREEFAWKNFPVSGDGAQGLKLAREYLGKHQKFYMPGNFRYWVIPKFIFHSYKENLREILISLEDLSAHSPGFGLGYEASRDFRAMEEDIAFLGREQFNEVLLTFLFYERPTAAQLKIRLAVDDVPPTRLRKLIKAQLNVGKLDTYNVWIRQTFKQSEQSGFGDPIRFSFGLVWLFFERRAQKGGESKFEADYLQFIRQLYLEHPPDSVHVLRIILEFLEALHRDPDTGEGVFNYRALQAMCWIRYLCELGLWKPAQQNRGDIMKLDDLSIEPELKKRRQDGRFQNSWMAAIESFYNEHTDMLRSPLLFGTFLLGCLIRLLMNVQLANIRSAPFEKELKGLRLKREGIPHLFSKTIAKLRDYDHGNTYKVLDELISDLCLRERSDETQVSNEEVSAYLAFGLAQGRVFKALVDAERKDASR